MTLEEWLGKHTVRQEDFAHVIGTSQANVSRWASGKYSPQQEARRWIAWATDGAVQQWGEVAWAELVPPARLRARKLRMLRAIAARQQARPMAGNSPQHHGKLGVDCRRGLAA